MLAGALHCAMPRGPPSHQQPAGHGYSVAMMVAENVQAIFESLHGQIFGSVTVRDARVMPADDEEGDDALYLALVLSDPDGDTWPLADVKAIRRRVVELSLQAGIPAVVFVRMLPESDAPQADDDAFRI